MSLNFKTKTTQKFKNRPDIGEELVKKFFKGRNGFFVDVGANHPTIDSQSYHLECIGWDGILIEPLKTYTNMLLKERSAKLIEVACSSRENHNKVLEINNLKVWYPIKKGILRKTVDHVKAVNKISFDLCENETLGIVGESGSGKTSLVLAILKLIKFIGLLLSL